MLAMGNHHSMFLVLVLILVHIYRQQGSANGIGAAASFKYPKGLSISSDMSFALVADMANGLIRHIDLSTWAVSTLTSPTDSLPIGVDISVDMSFALVTHIGNHNVVRIDLTTLVTAAAVTTTGSVTAVAGAGSAGFANGIGAVAKFDAPRGVKISADMTFALVADFNNQRVRRIDLATFLVTTEAGIGTNTGRF